jgi:hypothetical protein
MTLVELIVGVLAVWRLTHLFQAEDGPWELFVRLRQIAGSGFWGQLLDCFYCLSLWFSLPAALILTRTWHDALLLWLALSGGAILLERLTAPTPVVFEDPVKEESHDVLRQESSANRRSERSDER